MASARYAIYFTPHPETFLWHFGTVVIGYDAYNGSTIAAHERQPFVEFLHPHQVADPAQYGFHATLRAPFELREGATLDDVLAYAQALAQAEHAVNLGLLDVVTMGGFTALCPLVQTEETTAFAARCVQHFEPLRAPLNAADRVRRLKAPLSARQIELLEGWGYPYTFEQFQFHMSLTGKLEEADERATVLHKLASAYAPLKAEVTLDAISVLMQPARDQPFRIVSRVPLRVC